MSTVLILAGIGALVILGFLRRRARIRYIVANCSWLMVLWEEHLADLVEYGLVSPHDPFLRTLDKSLVTSMQALWCLKRFLRPVTAFVKEADAVDMHSLLASIRQDMGNTNHWLKCVAMELSTTVSATLRYGSTFNRVYFWARDRMQDLSDAVYMYVRLMRMAEEIEPEGL